MKSLVSMKSVESAELVRVIGFTKSNHVNKKFTTCALF